MKRITVLIVATLALAIAAQAQLTIGVNLSSTGPGAGLGIPEKNAISLGPTEIAGQKVRYVILDDASDPSTAVQNLKRLVSENHIDVLIGPSLIACTMALMNTAMEAKVPVITITPASAAVFPMDAKRKWVFKTVPNDDNFSAVMVPHMLKQGIKTASVITTDDPYGQGQTQSFQKFAEQSGIKILTVEIFNRSDTSTMPQVLRTMKANPDAVFIVASGTPAVLPHRTLVERGYTGKIYESGASANNDFLRLGGKEVDGTFMPTLPALVAEQLPDGYPTKQQALRFVQAYEAKFGVRATMAVNAWDALLLVQTAAPKALETAKPGTEQFRVALRDAIEQIKGLKASGAVFTMSPTDHTGINELGITMVQINNGKWKLAQHADFK